LPVSYLALRRFRDDAPLEAFSQVLKLFMETIAQSRVVAIGELNFG
jgi:hypothetical protein